MDAKLEGKWEDEEPGDVKRGRNYQKTQDDRDQMKPVKRQMHQRRQREIVIDLKSKLKRWIFIFWKGKNPNWSKEKR